MGSVRDINSRKKGVLYQLKQPSSFIFICLFSAIIVIPITVSVYQMIPSWRISFLGGLRVDLYVVLMLLFIVFYILIKKFSRFFIISLIIGFTGLTISSLIGRYSFKDLYLDYSTIYFSFTNDISTLKFQEETAEFKYKQRILNHIDYRNEIVKNKANAWAIANFSEYKSTFPSLKVLHCLSIFKEVRTRWNYVYDPKGDEYYSRASVTLNQLDDDDKLKGDCDDYSILLAGLFTAVGGDVQLVRTEVHTQERIIGHIYPELFIGNIKDLEKIAYFIKNEFFVIESMDKPIFYYVDLNKNVWLNMDYNDMYPGGKYQSKVRKSVLKVE
jgi:hypothetical protein